MSLLRKAVVFMARKLRGRAIDIDENIDFSDILELLIRNGISLLRGLLMLRRLAVVGKNVEFNCRRKLFIGTGVVIRDYAKINCVGKQGIEMGNGVSIGAFSMLSVSGSIADLGAGIRIGNNVGIGKDHTLFATTDGNVVFEKKGKFMRQFVSVQA